MTDEWKSHYTKWKNCRRSNSRVCPRCDKRIRNIHRKYVEKYRIKKKMSKYYDDIRLRLKMTEDIIGFVAGNRD